MPAKKAQSRGKAAASATDSNAVWKWVYVAGVLVAGITGALAFQNEILTWILMLVGVLVGIFFFDPADFMNFGLRYLILWAAKEAFNGFIAVGPYVTSFFTGFFNFLGPIVLTLAVLFFWKKYFGNGV
jgi:hypothetical protein